jgi:hypothetical protein
MDYVPVTWTWPYLTNKRFWKHGMFGLSCWKLLQKVTYFTTQTTNALPHDWAVKEIRIPCLNSLLSALRLSSVCKREQSRQQGCQIFIAAAYQNGKNIPNNQEIYQMSIIYGKWMYGLKIYQHVPLKDPPKFTQIWIFCLKIYHLATLWTNWNISCR